MTSEDFVMLEAVSRRSLRMYDLTERERRICDVIIEYSFGRGRESAVIPELQAFVDLTGIDKGDVTRALQRLLDKGIVQISGPVGELVYGFIPSAAFWNERKPLFDVERAVARGHQLEELNQLSSAGFEPTTGQGKLPLPADAPGFDEGLAMAAREDAVSHGCVGDSPICEGVSQIGKTPTTGGVGDSPICETASFPKVRAGARAGDVLQYVSTKRTCNTSPLVIHQRAFGDAEKNYVFELVETLAKGSPLDKADFERNRFKWVARVRDGMEIVREAAGNVKLWRSNPQNKQRQPICALLYRECIRIAQTSGKNFHLW